MANAALVLGWNRPVIGREAAAVEIFGTVMAYLEGQRGAGHVQSVEPVLLAPHGGDMNGFIIIRGDRDKLDAMRRTDEFIKLITRVTFSVDGIGLIDGYLAADLQKQFGFFGEVIAAGK